MNHCSWDISFDVIVYFLFSLDPENRLFLDGLGKRVGITTTCVVSCNPYMIFELMGFGEVE